MGLPLRIGIVVGESSGDVLGAGLMAELSRLHPGSVFEGIGGPLMLAQGFTSYAAMERLAVMGLEPLLRLPELLRIKKNLYLHFISNPPDVFIGIDAPEFNLRLEKKLRESAIKTVHYVSPSVWAWRKKRIKNIAQSIDLMLTLFPFEVDIYHQHQIPVSFVGHPLADEIPLIVDTAKAREKLASIPGNQLNSTPLNGKVLALLPGSRQSEVAHLAPAFLQAAVLCQQQWPELNVLLPCANQQRREQLEALIRDEFSELNISLLDGQSHDVMAASDFILIASGTATLEALLLKKPMLVCYRMSKFAYAIISRLLTVSYFSLPNLLAGRKLVEELVQDDVNPDTLFIKIKKHLNNSVQQKDMVEEFEKIHRSLRQNASQQAANKVLSLIR